MSRRIWFVLLIVVAVLAIAPMLPQWWPVAVTAVREFDYAALGHNIVAGVQAAMEYAGAHPQVVGGVAGGMLVMTLALRLTSQFGRAPRARASVEQEPAAIARASTEQEPALRTPQFGRSPSARASAEQEPAPNRRTGAGRGTAVRRLSLAGHSTAEIARATRVGQDAVRLVLHRPAFARQSVP